MIGCRSTSSVQTVTDLPVEWGEEASLPVVQLAGLPVRRWTTLDLVLSGELTSVGLVPGDSRELALLPGRVALVALELVGELGSLGRSGRERTAGGSRP